MKIKYSSKTITLAGSEIHRYENKKINTNRENGHEVTEIKDLDVGEYGYDLRSSYFYPSQRGYVIDIFEMVRKTSTKNYEFIHHIIVFDSRYEMGYYQLYDNILEAVMAYKPIATVKQLIDFANL